MHAPQRAGHFWRRKFAVQCRCDIDLPSEVRVLLSCDARAAVQFFAAPVDPMAGGTDVSEDFLTHAQMLARAGDRVRVGGQTGQVRGERDDVRPVAEYGMRGHHLHRRINPRSGAEQLELPFQIALALTGEIRDGAIRRTPSGRLVAHYAGRVETAAARLSDRR